MDKKLFFLIIAAAIIILLFYNMTLDNVVKINTFSFFFEMTISVFAFIVSFYFMKLDIKLQKINNNIKIGILLISFAMFDDALDEIYLHSELHSLFFKNLLMIVGFSLFTVGVYLYSKKNSHINHLLDKQVKEQTKTLKEKTTEMQMKYFHDSLTGLQNRNALLQNIQAYDSPKLVLIDINNFSAINNLYGGKVGDSVLKEFASILQEFSQYGCVTYRLGADQFVFVKHLQSQISCQDAAKMIIERIQNKPIYVTYNNTELELNLSVTLGLVSNVPKNKLLECADMALKYAKKTHQPFVIYDKNLMRRNDYQKTLNAVQLVKNAIINNQIIPYYQPIIKENEITFECLVRIHKDNKIITPDYFLDDIKYTSYYVDLTRIMIEKTFDFFKDKNYSFSINLSFEDILNTHITNLLLKKLQEYNMSNKLIIEILESESINNFQIVNEFIKTMKKFGVRIAIDDFGSGYSNYSYLLELKPDFIKVDGSLIKNINTDQKSLSIVKSIVELSKEMNIKVIVEYVHSLEVYDTLKPLQVYGFQGFYLGKPNPGLENKSSI